MKKTSLLFLGLGLVLLAGCSDLANEEEASNAAPEAPSAVSETEETIADEESAPTGELKEFNITAKKWSFEPARIVVKKGDRVKFNITSTDVAHGIGMSAFDVNIEVEAGETGTVEFVADKVGEFSFVCNVLCGVGHSEMKGVLVVEE